VVTALHVSPNGLTFDEFDRYFPAWLREYYREHKSVEMGAVSKFHTLNVQSAGMLHPSMQGGGTGSGSTQDALVSAIGLGLGGGSLGSMDRKDLKKKQNMASKGGKLAAMLGADAKQGGSHGKGGRWDRSTYTAESLEWERKLSEVARDVDKTNASTRGKIWDKFDRKQVGKLDVEKSLPRLIYSFFALFCRSKDRDAKPPKYQLLQPLLKDICAEIREMLPQRDYITKQDFLTQIAVYLGKIASNRKRARR